MVFIASRSLFSAYNTPHILLSEHNHSRTHIMPLCYTACNQILALTGLDQSRGLPCAEIGNENCLLYHRQEYGKHRCKIAEVTRSIISDHRKRYQAITDQNNTSFVPRSGVKAAIFWNNFRAGCVCTPAASHLIRSGLGACRAETKYLWTFRLCAGQTPARWGAQRRKAMYRQGGKML